MSGTATKIPARQLGDPVVEQGGTSPMGLERAGVGCKYELIAFDGDDTLWRTQQLYDAAKDDFEALSKDLGIWDSALRHELDTIDSERVAVFGFSPARFPGSLVEVLRLYAERCGTTLPRGATRCALRIGESVFKTAAPVQAGAPSLLQALSQKYRLILITKGDPIVQEWRLANSGLRSYFESIHIVSDKSAEMLRKIFEHKEIEPSRVLVVGDSLRSDVRPALEAGAAAIWIASPSWQYERADIPCSNQLSKVESLEELALLL